MFNEIIFQTHGRLLLAGIFSIVIFLIALLIVCCLTPGCLGHKCLKKQKKRREKTETTTTMTMTSTTRSTDQQCGNIKLSDVSYRSWRIGSLYDNGSICENSETSPTNSYGTNGHNNFNDPGVSSTLNLVDSGKQKNEKKIKDFPTEIKLSLQYLPNCEDTISNNGKLVIGVESLSGLPPKQYNCTLEPYVTVEIVKYSWTHRKKDVLHFFRTRSIRHTANPIFRETFVIADVDLNEAKEWTLNIVAYDHDRYANHTELCSLRISLKDVKNIFTSPEIHLFNYKMKISSQEFGGILLGISYLPTAQRLTINVMKLRAVKYPQNIKPINFHPYVRILMLNSKTGRKLRKRKTHVLSSPNQLLEFNETLTFDLSFHQLDNVQFIVILCNKIAIDEVPVPMTENPSDSEESTNSFNKSTDICIGKVALGKGVRGSTERLHWFSVLQNPRKLVTVWHTLK